MKFYRAGDSALLMEFEQRIAPEVNDLVLAMAKNLETDPLPGVREVLPTYCSLLVLFEGERMGFEELCAGLKARMENLSGTREGEGREVRIWKVPCCYGSHFGPDLANVCDHSGLSREEVIARHSGTEYRIYMLGFLPGFVYLGGLDPGLAMPRLKSPRLKIPRGAVGIGGSQTGIYPLASPGGWQLIGNTPLDLYDPDREDPVFFRAGDRIRFYPVNSCEYYDIRQAILRGTYEPELIIEKNGKRKAASFRQERAGGMAPLEKETIGGKTQDSAQAVEETGGSAAGTAAGNTAAVLETVHPGLLATVQDGGRYGFQKLGMPVSGAMDPGSYRKANRILGNEENAAAIELTLWGGSWRFLKDTEFALTGADMNPKKNGEPVPMNERCSSEAGDLLEFEAAKTGCRTYLALAGGIDVPEVMGSRSTYAKCGIGGLEGRALRKGDVLGVCAPDGNDRTSPCREPAAAPAVCGSGNAADADASRKTESKASETGQSRKDAEFPKGDGTGHITVRVVPGPQDGAFTEEGRRTFYSAEYQLTDRSDRMGCRLEGPVIETVKGTDIISDGTVFGSIQVTGAGRPIVLMADRQTTGGYAKIATVLSADLPLLAQAVPGTRIHFTEA